MPIAGEDWPSGDARRRLLLQACQVAATNRPVAALHEQLRSMAAAAGIPFKVHAPLVGEAPRRGAVRVAHALEFAAPGMQCWQALWPAPGADWPGEQLALLAAQLFSHREAMLLLVVRRRPGDGECSGALVDAGTCARVAVAGYDVDTELLLGNPLLLLEAAGDLLLADDPDAGEALPGEAPDVEYLLLGLKWHAAVAD